MNIELWQIIAGMFLALLSLLGYNTVKRRSAEALLENLDTNKKLNEKDQEIVKDRGLSQVEEERRKEIQKEIDEAKDKKDSLDDINDFFNKP